jgi:glycerol-3-phosphate dehydrogenase
MDRIHPRGPDVWAQVYHAVEREWAVNVEDIVRRRTTLAVRGLATEAVRAEVERVTETVADFVTEPQRTFASAEIR